MLETAAFFGADALSQDVNGAANGGHRNFSGAKTALYLHLGSNGIESKPIGPIYGAVFHVVDRNAVNHDAYVALVETAHVDARIAVAAALIGGIYAGRSVEEHR